MALLDFSAAFDTVDHDLLINKLENSFDITDVALDWFKSYLSGRSYKVKINDILSDPQPLKFGVPQGSILGPILYSLYIKDIEEIACKYNINIHIYADDVQLYTKYSQETNLSNFKLCLNEIKSWTEVNFLKLNDKKTQLICFSRNYSNTIPIEMELMGQNIKVQDSVKYLGVWLDKSLTFSKQISSVCSGGFIMLKNLWKISNKVTDIEIRKQLIHSCILSRLNFCNSIYYSLPNYQLSRLHKLLKAGTRYIFRITGPDRRNPMTPYLQKLHFLPVSLRINFKICLLIYKTFNNQSPDYLNCLLIPRKNKSDIELRKDNDRTWLDKYPIEQSNFRCRGYRHAAPDLWNDLPQSIRESPSAEVFRIRLKTFYFDRWLNPTFNISC